MGRTTITVTISLFHFLGACALEPVEDDGEIEWSPDGGVIDEEPEFATEDEFSDLEPLAMPFYQLPFKCRQVWRGETRRNHSPRLAIDFNHDGGDFGRDVRAAANGKVTVFADTGSDSYGKWLEIGHGGGHRTRYAHLSKRTVSFNQKVKKGQKIGEVGDSGGADGSHLHYEQLVNTNNNVRVRFNGNIAHYYGERRYTSHNCN